MNGATDSMGRLKPLRPEVSRTASATNAAKLRVSAERAVPPTASTAVLRTNNLLTKKRKPTAGTAQSGGIITSTQTLSQIGLKSQSLK